MNIYNNITLGVDYNKLIPSLIDGSVTEVPAESLSDITRIGTHAFYGCTSLTKIDIPSNITRIDSRAFEGCTSLTTVNIANVGRIGGGAFQGCTSLASITLPASFWAMDINAFKNCSSLISFTVLALTPPAIDISGGEFPFSNTPIASGTGYIYVPASSVAAYKATSGWSIYASQIRAIPE